MQCSSAEGKMKSPLFSAALQSRLTAGSVSLLHASWCRYKYTCEDLLFILLCSDPTPVHCNTVLGKKQSPLSSAIVKTW